RHSRVTRCVHEDRLDARHEERHRVAAEKLNRPMRFTGQMFFHGAQPPCSSDCDATHTPRRFASWETHPVYAMDVCKFTTKAKCRVDHDADWVSFQQWMDAVEGDEEPGD